MTNQPSFNHLNDQQRQAVTTVDGAVLVIAGAGSGKTRVLTERIAHLLRDHRVAPWEILAFTFTNKAAREMKDRLERNCPGASTSLWVGTFHSTGVRILRRSGEAIGLRRDFSIYDSDDSLGLAKNILSRFPMDARFAKSPRALRDRFSRWKNDLVTPEMAKEQAGDIVAQRLALLYAEYEKELRRANALDFDDLIGRVVELFSVSDEVRNTYARRFRYVLVDEFQDTNAIQMAMIDALSSVHKNLFAVGDDDQSIYSWRGARVDHILEFEDVYPGTNVIRLEQNYRSTQTILDAANHVIANNRGRKGKNLWTVGDVGEKVRLLAAVDEEGEAVGVLRAIRSHIDAGTPLKEIAVLYRTNAQSRALEDVLKMGSLPYQIIGSVRFYERMEVRDILAWCKVIVNPADTINLRRIINIPKRGIGKTTVDRLEAAALEQGISVVDVLRRGSVDIGRGAGARCGEFLRLFETLCEYAESRVAPDVVEKVIADTGYLDYLRQNYPDSDSRVENAEEFVSAALSYAEGAENKSLAAFLEEVALVADVDSLDLERGALTLMTLHNAKGLEFDCVLITGMEEGLLPHYNSLDSEKATEEERRLFYVGITRARRHLYLSFAGMRRRMGMVEGGVPSRFLSEVPEGCLDGAVPAVPTGRAAVGGGDGWGFSGRRRALFDSDAVAPQKSPNYEMESQEEIRGYQVGMRISHDNYGAGVVRRVEGSGENTRVTVIFDRGGERKFLAHFAPMRPA